MSLIYYADLDKAQLDRKIRLLSLATLGFQNVGADLSYATVASTIQIQESEVERWVIDGMPPLFILSAQLSCSPILLSLSTFTKHYLNNSHSCWPHHR